MQTEQLEAPSLTSTHPDVAIARRRISPAAVAAVVLVAVVGALVAVLVLITPLRVPPQITATNPVTGSTAGLGSITSSNAFTSPRPERPSSLRPATITSSNAFTGASSGPARITSSNAFTSPRPERPSS